MHPGGGAICLIIRRYLLRELGMSLGVVLAVLMLIYISNRFVKFLAEAAAGRIASDAILGLLGLKLVGHVVLLLPLAVFLAVLLALGRLYRDSEVIAMGAGGMGTRRLVQSILGFALILAVVTAVLSMYVSPAVATLQESLRKRAEHESTVAAVIPGRFKSVGAGRILYVGGVDREQASLLDVFVESPGDAGTDILVSRRAFQLIEGAAEARYMILEDGYRYRGVPGHADYSVTRFARHGVRLDDGRRDGFLKTESVATAQLLGSDDRLLRAELQWRLSLPLSVLLLGALAVPLARTSPREGRYGRLLVAVLVYFLYNNALGIARTLIERGDIVPALGVWPVHLVVAIAGGWMIFAQSSVRWRLQVSATQALRRR